MKTFIEAIKLIFSCNFKEFLSILDWVVFHKILPFLIVSGLIIWALFNIAFIINCIVYYASMIALVFVFCLVCSILPK